MTGKGRMHVGLSVDALTPELTGIGRYCWELASRLADQPQVERLSFWRDRDKIYLPAELLEPSPLPRRSQWRRNVRRFANRLGLLRPERAGIDLFHGPNFMLPRWVECGVITVHDLSVLRYPETHPAARIAMFERDFENSLKRCSHVITPSETTRNEVLQYTGMAAEKVTAVAMGVGANMRPLPADVRNPALTRLGLPLTGYGLTVSALEPRKRIERLLAAWRALPNPLRDRYPLVVAGAKGWGNEALRAAVEQAAREGWVIPLGFVAEADLPALYGGARLFVYPSLYEGFGLPPIEAMACGVPTIVANASCLPEITAGAAMLVEPDDIDDFCAALSRGLTDEQWRQGAVVSGLQVAAGYGWDDCARRTARVYKIAK